MVLTSNQILIIKDLFASRSAKTKSELLKIGLTLKELEKEMRTLLEDNVVESSSKGYKMSFHKAGARDYIQRISAFELSQEKNLALWAKEIAKVRSHALSALFSYENKIFVLIIAPSEHHRKVRKDIVDISLFTKQIIDVTILSPEEFVSALKDESHTVHSYLRKGTVAFGLNNLCDLLS